MTAEVRFLNLASNLWRAHDTEPYMKCVFFNTDKAEFVFTDLNDAREETQCIFLNDKYEVRYLFNREAAEKVTFWLQSHQNTVVARQDEVQALIKTIRDEEDLDAEQLKNIEHLFVPIEFK